MIINCPLPAVLTRINPSDCPFKIDQLSRLIFQRRQAIPPFSSLADIQDVDNWRNLLLSDNNDRVVLSPIFANATIPESAALTTGGNDNTTFNGIRQYNGEGSITVTGTFYNLTPKAKFQLMNLSQESLSSALGVSNLTVYMVNRSSEFVTDMTGTHDVPTGWRGFPIYNFRISSVGSAGFNAPNTHGFSFDMMADWDNMATMVKPDFDPLADLVQPSDVALVATVSPSTLSIAAGGSFTFSVSIAGGVPPFAKQWKKSGVNIAGAVGNSYTKTGAVSGDAAVYTCEVTDAAGVIDMSTTGTLTVT